MASSATASTGIILAVVILSLTFAPNWSIVFAILLGMIMKNNKTTPGQSSPTDIKYKRSPPKCPECPTSSPRPRAYYDSPLPCRRCCSPGCLPPPPCCRSGYPLPPLCCPPAPPCCRSPPCCPPAPSCCRSVYPLPPPCCPPARPGYPQHPRCCHLASADDASPPAGDASAPAVDALAPALAVDAAGKKRRNPESSSTSSSSFGIEYKVFLNFRGTDTHATITDHLNRALIDGGISVFKEVEELRVGKEIRPQVKEAINQSRISIAVISTDYASNENCLNELVQMWECRELNGQIIIPIFYNISPSDVRHMAGDFGEAFNLHETAKVDSITIKKWRKVLRETGKLLGYSGNLYKGYEGQLVEDVVVRVARILRDDGLVVTDKLVGIDLHVQEVMRKLGVAHSEGRATEVHGEDVRVVGICGVPGVGKTTLAKVVFNKMHDLFDACSFLPRISSKGVQFSRRILIADFQIENPAPLESSGDRIEEIASLCRNAKVLIVLDDVDEDEQIKALAGKLIWFGPGSRIIVTTNKRGILSAFDIGADNPGTVEKHEVEPRSDDHALQLFRNHYFQGDASEDISEDDSLSML